MRPIMIQGQKLYHGNRLFNFDLINNRIELKLSKYNHILLEYKQPNKHYYNKLIRLQQLIDNNQITVTIKIDKEYIYFIFEQTLLEQVNPFKDLKSNRIMGLDLNPNYIGLSILEFDSNDQFNVIYKQVFDIKSINNNNKRKHQLIDICYKINNLINVYKCSRLVIEDLSIKPKNHNKGKWFNKLVNNKWNKNIIINKIKSLSNIYKYQIVQINPIYSSIIGNLLYGNQNTPDMIAASIQIARRGYNKYKKNWFYPIFDINQLNEQWKQTLNGLNNWIEVFDKIKNFKLKYRVQLKDCINQCCFRLLYSKHKVKYYIFE